MLQESQASLTSLCKLEAHDASSLCKARTPDMHVSAEKPSLSVASYLQNNLLLPDVTNTIDLCPVAAPDLRN